MGGLDNLGVCIQNCAQCKKMYGTYFEGQMCADACVKFKGKIIPGTYNRFCLMINKDFKKNTSRMLYTICDQDDNYNYHKIIITFSVQFQIAKTSVQSLHSSINSINSWKLRI